MKKIREITIFIIFQKKNPLYLYFACVLDRSQLCVNNCFQLHLQVNILIWLPLDVLVSKCMCLCVLMVTSSIYQFVFIGQIIEFHSLSDLLLYGHNGHTLIHCLGRISLCCCVYLLLCNVSFRNSIELFSN